MATTITTAIATSEMVTAASGIIENIVLETTDGGSFNGAHHFAIHDSTFLDVGGNVIVDVHYDRERGLDLLYPAISANALFDSSERCSPSMPLPAVHQDLMEHLQQWIENPEPQHRIKLMSGRANTGKSLLAQMLAEHYQGAESNGNTKRFAAASFLFPTGKNSTVGSNHIIPTLAYQFAYSNPAITNDIVQPVLRDRAVLQKNMSAQLRNLVIGPLEQDKTNRRFSTSTPIPIIIDGLDTWAAGYERQKEFIDVIKKAVSGNLPFRFVIFTRMEGKLKGLLQEDGMKKISEPFELDERYKIAIESRLKTLRSHVERRENKWISRQMRLKVIAIRGFIG
ncbi:hypothetical protein BDQ17DRAFT_1433539 [Cyathus striatus]|nr:hypothetical protein BDQ17DRAFT_1433539 [Cyathus striatus]